MDKLGHRNPCSVTSMSPVLSNVSWKQNPCAAIKLYYSTRASQTYPSLSYFLLSFGRHLSCHSLTCPFQPLLIWKNPAFWKPPFQVLGQLEAWLWLSHSPTGTTSKSPPSLTQAPGVDGRSLSGLWTISPGTHPCQKSLGCPGQLVPFRQPWVLPQAGPGWAAVCRTLCA